MRKTMGMIEYWQGRFCSPSVQATCQSCNSLNCMRCMCMQREIYTIHYGYDIHFTIVKVNTHAHAHERTCRLWVFLTKQII